MRDVLGRAGGAESGAAVGAVGHRRDGRGAGPGGGTRRRVLRPRRVAGVPASRRPAPSPFRAPRRPPGSRFGRRLLHALQQPFVIVDRRDDFESRLRTLVGEDHGIRTQFLSYFTHGLTDVGGIQSFDLHGFHSRCCRDFRVRGESRAWFAYLPTVAMTLSFLSSGISLKARTWRLGIPCRAKRASMTRIASGTSNTAG